jgi:hypothetical protein
MRYANAAYLKAALDRIQGEVSQVDRWVSELQELKAKGLLKDPQEESYMSQLRGKWMAEEKAELEPLWKIWAEEDDIRRKQEKSNLEEYFKNIEDDWSAEHSKEDELANLLTWIKQDEIDQKAYGGVVLDGDHVYPLPVELF